MNPGRNAAHQKENFEQDPGILRIFQEPCRLFTSYPTHLPNLGGSGRKVGHSFAKGLVDLYHRVIAELAKTGVNFSPIRLNIDSLDSLLEGLHTMMKRKALWALLAAGMTVVSTGIVSAQSTIAAPRVGMLGGV